jgi:transposase
LRIIEQEWGEAVSKRVFADKEIELLSKNQYVRSVSLKGITYTDEFKRIFVAEYENGRLPREIFEERGFDISIIGIQRVQSSSKRWRDAYKTVGIIGLSDSRRGNSGRPRETELSLEGKYERLKAQNNLLKAENELLKKIEMLERGMRKKK